MIIRGRRTAASQFLRMLRNKAYAFRSYLLLCSLKHIFQVFSKNLFSERLYHVWTRSWGSNCMLSTNNCSIHPCERRFKFNKINREGFLHRNNKILQIKQSSFLIEIISIIYTTIICTLMIEKIMYTMFHCKTCFSSRKIF